MPPDADDYAGMPITPDPLAPGGATYLITAKGRVISEDGVDLPDPIPPVEWFEAPEWMPAPWGRADVAVSDGNPSAKAGWRSQPGNPVPVLDRHNVSIDGE